MDENHDSRNDLLCHPPRLSETGSGKGFSNPPEPAASADSSPAKALGNLWRGSAKMGEKRHIEPLTLMDGLSMNYPNLKPLCRLLAFKLYANYGLLGPSFYTSESKLAEWCHVHRNAVGKNLRKLKETGLITWIRGSRDPKAGQANQYDVRPPTIADLRGSGSLEQDAFSVTLIYKDEQVMNYWNDEQISANRPVHLVPLSTDDDLMLDNIRSLGAVWVNFAKNQNGRTGELPFVVYQNHYRWFVGDRFAPQSEHGKPKNLNKFLKITADWRFLQSPFRDVEKAGGKWELIDDPRRPDKQIKDHPYVVYPDYWELKAEKICKDFGWVVPDYIANGVNRITNASLRQDTLEPTKDTAPAKSLMEPTYVQHQKDPSAVTPPPPPSAPSAGLVPQGKTAATEQAQDDEPPDDPNDFLDDASDAEEPDSTPPVDIEAREEPTAGYYSPDGTDVLEDNPF